MRNRPTFRAVTHMHFLGREHEVALLRDWHKERDGSYLTVIYGRRRIGKTRLVEEAFQDIPLLKFEGLEGESTAAQQRHFLDRLAELSGKPEFKRIRNPRRVPAATIAPRGRRVVHGVGRRSAIPGDG